MNTNEEDDDKPTGLLNLLAEEVRKAERDERWGDRHEYAEAYEEVLRDGGA